MAGLFYLGIIRLQGLLNPLFYPPKILLKLGMILLLLRLWLLVLPWEPGILRLYWEPCLLLLLMKFGAVCKTKDLDLGRTIEIGAGSA